MDLLSSVHVQVGNIRLTTPPQMIKLSATQMATKIVASRSLKTQQTHIIAHETKQQDLFHRLCQSPPALMS